MSETIELTLIRPKADHEFVPGQDVVQCSNDENGHAPGQCPDGSEYQKLELTVGDVVYRAIAFADGDLRIYDARGVRPVGQNSVIIEPFKSEAARKMSREQTGPSDDLADQRP